MKRSRIWERPRHSRDLEEMIAAKLTFDEAVSSARLPVMAKQRLKVVQRDLFEQLSAIGL